MAVVGAAVFRVAAWVLVTSSWLMRGNPGATMTSPGSPRGGGSVTVQWAVNEERSAGSVIGDLRQSLAQFIDAARLAATSFQTLPRPHQDLDALDVDRTTGVVRATERRLDREEICETSHQNNMSADCTMHISIGLVHALQLEQVRAASRSIIPHITNS